LRPQGRGYTWFDDSHTHIYRITQHMFVYNDGYIMLYTCGYWLYIIYIYVSR
jgi:hypothetical protein